MHQNSLYYLLAINAVTFLLYAMDKYKAKKDKCRISEATLLTMAARGGSIGAWVGMRIWHHKTMPRKFNGRSQVWHTPHHHLAIKAVKAQEEGVN